MSKEEAHYWRSQVENMIGDMGKSPADPEERHHWVLLLDSIGNTRQYLHQLIEYLERKEIK